MTSVLGDFYMNSNSCGKNDTTFLEGSMVAAVASNHELYKLIQKPHHISESLSSCNEIVFYLKKSHNLYATFPK